MLINLVSVLELNMRKFKLDHIEELLDFWLKISSSIAFIGFLAIGAMLIAIPLVFKIPT